MSFFTAKNAFFSASTTFGLFGRAIFSSSSSSDLAKCDNSSSTTSSSSSPISTETIRSGANWNVPWDSEWDSSVVKPSTGADKNIKRQIILIRHGQYQNEGKKGAEDSERTLTDKGILQAQLTGSFLRKAILQVDDQTAGEIFQARSIKSFTSSNLTRAMQTCDHVIEQCDPGMKKWWSIDAGLAERFPCDPSPPYPKKAKQSCHDVVEGTFKKYIHRPKAGTTENTIEVIVCHANIIRYFLCRSLQLPPEAWLRLSLPHCSITSVSIRGNGNVSVNQVGGVTHLPIHLQTLSNC